MALATSECRDSLARLVRIQICRSATSGATRSAQRALGEPFERRLAVDLSFDVEDRIDALHRLERHRRDDGKLAACLGGDVGEHEERASCMRPAGGLSDRPSLAARLVQSVETGVAVGLQDAAIAVQVTLDVLAGAVARVEEHCRGRIAATERTIVAHIDPEPSGRGLPLGEHRHRCLVAMHALAGEHVRTDQIVQRPQ